MTGIVNKRLPALCVGHESITLFDHKNTKPEHLSIRLHEDQPSYCFIFELKEPVTLSLVELKNSGTAFVTVRGANASNASRFILSTLDPLRPNEKLSFDSSVKSSYDHIREWPILVPETQLLSLDQLEQQDLGKINRLRRFKISPNPYIDETKQISIICVECRPFYDLWQIDEHKESKKNEKKNKSREPPSVGLTWVSFFGRPLV